MSAAARRWLCRTGLLAAVAALLVVPSLRAAPPAEPLFTGSVGLVDVQHKLETLRLLQQRGYYVAPQRVEALEQQRLQLIAEIELDSTADLDQRIGPWRANTKKVKATEKNTLRKAVFKYAHRMLKSAVTRAVADESALRNLRDWERRVNDWNLRKKQSAHEMARFMEEVAGNWAQYNQEAWDEYKEASTRIYRGAIKDKDDLLRGIVALEKRRATIDASFETLDYIKQRLETVENLQKTPLQHLQSQVETSVLGYFNDNYTDINEENVKWALAKAWAIVGAAHSTSDKLDALDRDAALGQYPSALRTAKQFQVLASVYQHTLGVVKETAIAAPVVPLIEVLEFYGQAIALVPTLAQKFAAVIGRWDQEALGARGTSVWAKVYDDRGDVWKTPLFKHYGLHVAAAGQNPEYYLVVPPDISPREHVVLTPEQYDRIAGAVADERLIFAEQTLDWFTINLSTLFGRGVRIVTKENSPVSRQASQEYLDRLRQSAGRSPFTQRQLYELAHDRPIQYGGRAWTAQRFADFADVAVQTLTNEHIVRAAQGSYSIDDHKRWLEFRNWLERQDMRFTPQRVINLFRFFLDNGLSEVEQSVTRERERREAALLGVPAMGVPLIETAGDELRPGQRQRFEATIVVDGMAVDREVEATVAWSTEPGLGSLHAETITLSNGANLASHAFQIPDDPAPARLHVVVSVTVPPNEHHGAVTASGRYSFAPPQNSAAAATVAGGTPAPPPGGGADDPDSPGGPGGDSDGGGAPGGVSAGAAPQTTDVSIDIPVTDLADQPIDDAMRRAQTSGGENAQGNTSPLALPVADGETVTASAEAGAYRDDAAPIVFEAASVGGQITMPVQLPFWDTGNLTVLGAFLADAGSGPAPASLQGVLTANMMAGASIDSDGGFRIVNDRPWPESEPLVLEGLFWDQNGRLYRPAGGRVSIPLTPGPEFDAGVVALVPETVRTPVRAIVVDAVGRPVPEQQVTVAIGGSAAAPHNGVFEAPWTFTRGGELLSLRAEFALPDGQVATATESYTFDAMSYLRHGLRDLPDPFRLRLPVLLGYTVRGATDVDAPRGAAPPETARVAEAATGADRAVTVGAPFRISVTGPVLVGAQRRVVARANKAGVEYEAESPYVAPVDSTEIDVGTLTLEPKGDLPVVRIEDLRVHPLGGSGRPDPRQGLRATARLVFGDVSDVPALGVEWRRLSDGDGQVEIIQPASDTDLPIEVTLGPLPSGGLVRADVLELVVSDGLNVKVPDRVDFDWAITDEFLGMTIRDASSGNIAPRFHAGGAVTITSQWKIAPATAGASPSRPQPRALSYSVGGRTVTLDPPASVTPGSTWTSPPVTLELPDRSGAVEVRAELLDPATAASTPGAQTIRLRRDRDEIIRAWAATGANGPIVNEVARGEAVVINAWVAAAKGRDGERTLRLRAGRHREARTISLYGGEGQAVAFTIPTGGARLGRESVRLALYGPDGDLEDHTFVRFRIVEQPPPPPVDQDGLDDVYCTGDTVTIKIWDHGTQDGDIVSIYMGGVQVYREYNMDSSGGPGEPTGGPGVLRDLPLPVGTRVTITVYAHNTGSVGPNTAKLKVDGGCTPAEQQWGLQEGGQGSLSIIRLAPGQAPPPQR